MFLRFLFAFFGFGFFVAFMGVAVRFSLVFAAVPCFGEPHAVSHNRRQQNRQRNAENRQMSGRQRRQCARRGRLRVVIAPVFMAVTVIVVSMVVTVTAVSAMITVAMVISVPAVVVRIVSVI